MEYLLFDCDLLLIDNSSLKLSKKCFSVSNLQQKLPRFVSEKNILRLKFILTKMIFFMSLKCDLQIAFLKT